MKAICAVLLCCFLIIPTSAADVPILMYHDFVEDNAPCGEFAVTESCFREHLSALSEAGYTSVTFADLIDHVDSGKDLPEKPIIITADDGYTGVVNIAVPIAEEFGMTISCAVIGGMAGAGGHFSLDDPYAAKTEVTSHTFDLHYADDLGYGVNRVSSEILAEDCAKMRTKMLVFAEEYPMIFKVFTYPYGAYSAESEEILEDMGYRVTVTCDKGIARVEKNAPESLRKLPRIGVYQSMSAAALLNVLK